MGNMTLPRRNDAQHPVAHYIALLLPTEIGEWRVLFPDVTDCEARGSTVQDATCAAAAALARCGSVKGRGLPSPRGLAQIESDHEWFRANGIALSEAVVTMVPLWPTPDYLRP